MPASHVEDPSLIEQRQPRKPAARPQPRAPRPSPAKQAPSSDIHRLIGPFMIENKLGVGGMGIVYKATYTKNGAECAVKVLPLVLSGELGLQRCEPRARS